MTFSTIFQLLIVAFSFNGGRNWSSWRNPL